MRSSNGPSKLFVGDIGDNRKQDISRVFSKYGEISTIYVDEYKHFAFVEFTSSSDAKRALEHTNNKTVNGAKLRVEYAKSDKPSRDHRRGLSRERSPTAALYNHLQVTANRLPSMQTVRQSYYQHYPSTMMTNPAMPRGRSLTPPSFKQNSRLPSMNHLRTPDFYPPYYPPHPAVYPDPAYYRAYGDPYLMQRLPPAFLPSTSPPPPPTSSSSSSSRAYRNIYLSSGLDRYPPVMSHRRSRRSRSRSRRRSSPSRKNRSSRERKHQRRTPSSSSPRQKRERGPQTPPSSHRIRKRSRSSSDTPVSTSEQKSSSSSSSDDETNQNQQSNFKKSLDTDSNRKHLSKKKKE